MIKAIYKSLILAGLLTSAACASMKSNKEYVETDEYRSRPTLKKDLLTAEGQYLTDKQVNTLLNNKVNLNKPLKVAVVKLGHSVDQKYYANYREQTSYHQYATAANTKAFESILNKKGRIKDISFVPSVLMPKDQSLRSLRDVAALMQADLLLIIYTKTEADYDFVVVGKNEAKAVATLESIAMDVRTGTIPFTSLATGIVQSKKDKKDFSNEEFRARVIIEAEDQAIDELAKSIGEYFG